MVSKARTPKRNPTTKSLKDRRRFPRKKSPAKALIYSINKTINTCKRRLAKIFSKLARISTTSTTTRHRRKGYALLKARNGEEQRDGVCKVLCFNEESRDDRLLVLPPLTDSDKRTIFLDLDETLVHSKADPPPERFDFIVRPKIDGELMNFYVLKRPGVDAFLEKLGEKYEVVVFTAGLREYASLVLDKLDKKRMIAHRLYRDSCKEVDGKFVKDLSDMGRDLKKVVIVDDNPNCYVFQPENAIPIRPFVDDFGDGELGDLVRFFDVCDCFDDMRDAVKKFVEAEEQV